MTTPPPPDVTAVVFNGDLDFSNYADTLARLRAAVESGRDVEVDLADVRFVDSAAVSAILHARRLAIASGHRLFVSGMSEAVRRPLELMGLVDLIAGR
ncbi:STAS domain-containing protein [Hamadaea sp. NPDC050747]|uniref:STAS domain-containing protein n=1 Tax=Hamadaea sp. NPDC050747 TaxID=3155789 RepID=UPI0033C2C1BD